MRSFGHFNLTLGPHGSAAATPAAMLNRGLGSSTNETSNAVPSGASHR